MEILVFIVIMVFGVIVFGVVFGFVLIKFKVEGDLLVEKIESILL